METGRPLEHELAVGSALVSLFFLERDGLSFPVRSLLRGGYTERSDLAYQGLASFVAALWGVD